MRKPIPNVLFAALGLLAAIVAVRFIVNRHHVESAEELTELALRAGSPADQEQAATRLEALADKTPGTESRNAVQSYLIRLLNESNNPGVRAAAMRGLAAIWDYAVPAEDARSARGSFAAGPLLRRHESVAKLIDANPRFDANAPDGRARRGCQAAAWNVGEFPSPDP